MAGYRHYNPKLGRWINRDPIAELGSYLLASATLGQEQWFSKSRMLLGSINTYESFDNSPAVYVDRDGRDSWAPPPPWGGGGNNCIGYVCLDPDPEPTLPDDPPDCGDCDEALWDCTARALADLIECEFNVASTCWIICSWAGPATALCLGDCELALQPICAAEFVGYTSGCLYDYGACIGLY